MKIGTDGVLLAAWTSLTTQPTTILDIGAGTGVLSLMLAQRSTAEEIDAVEIDEAAFEQCTENFENSPWSDRLFCYHASLLEFAQEMDETYDLIISNPPFYTEDFKSTDTARDLARFNESMPFEHLIACAQHLLSDQGIFAVVIPRKEEEGFLALAEKYNLFPKRCCRVQGHTHAPEKRTLLELHRERSSYEPEYLVLETARHQYTQEYIALVKDFYLKM